MPSTGTVNTVTISEPSPRFGACPSPRFDERWFVGFDESSGCPSPHPLVELLQGQAALQHFGEPLSLLEHSLQCAYLADVDGASESMVAAALLHDIGWLVPTSIEMAEVDSGAAAAKILETWFPPAVTEPVRLQVLATRYLYTVDEIYRLTLSDRSLYALYQQGGPLDARQTVHFVSTKFAPQAVQLRRWDDRAKSVGATVPGLARYDALLARQVLASSAPGHIG